MFGKKECDVPRKVKHRFEYTFGFKNGEGQEFFSDFDSTEEAQAARQQVMTAFADAMSGGKPTVIENTLVVRGEELIWFWVGEVESK